MSYLLNPYGFAGGGGSSPAVVGQALLYTGTGSAHGITGADFSPDLVIAKLRPGTTGDSWHWVDNVRGAGLEVRSNSSNGESSDAGGVTSFDANGFSVGTSGGYNTNGSNFLSLLLQRVSGGFDIVTYTGTGVAHAINHGLGVVPDLIIIFARNVAGPDVSVYASPFANTNFLKLNTTAALLTAGSIWNSTTPTSTQFTVGTSSEVNFNGGTYVAYLFANLNPGVAVGTYTGNGGTNGPAVSIGFRGKFGIFKRTDATSNWVLFDNQRDVTSPHNTYSHPNLGDTNSEQVCTNAAGGVDFGATTFQAQDADGTNCALNVNGGTYLYLAVA
jgi:hypothetical protein